MSHPWSLSLILLHHVLCFSASLFSSHQHEHLKDFNLVFLQLLMKFIHSKTINLSKVLSAKFFQLLLQSLFNTYLKKYLITVTSKSFTLCNKFSFYHLKVIEKCEIIFQLNLIFIDEHRIFPNKLHKWQISFL